MKYKNGKCALGLTSVILSLTFASTAFAWASESDALRIKAYAFVKSQLKGETAKELKGHTSTGEPCALFLTDRSAGQSEDYYVVVGYLNAKSMNDYIGVVASESAASESLASVKFLSENSWGNNSKSNHVIIKADLTEAVGISDLKQIYCKLD